MADTGSSKFPVCHFFRLPRELRDEIYSYLIFEPYSLTRKWYCVPWICTRHLVPARIWHSRIPRSILLANHQLNDETTDFNQRYGGRLEIQLDDFQHWELQDPQPSYGPRYLVEDLASNPFRRVLLGLDVHSYCSPTQNWSRSRHVISTCRYYRELLDIFCRQLGKSETKIQFLEVRIRDMLGRTYPPYVRMGLGMVPPPKAWEEDYWAEKAHMLEPFRLLNLKVSNVYVEFLDRLGEQDLKTEYSVAEKMSRYIAELVGVDRVSVKAIGASPSKQIKVSHEAQVMSTLLDEPSITDIVIH